MASRYWVGGTANWDGIAGTKWATTSGGAGGASAPTTADDVFFDAASGAVTVTVSSGHAALSINCTGFTGTLSASVTINVSGSVTIVAGMTVTGGISWSINGTGTFTSGGKSFSSFTVSGSGITVTLGSALSLSLILTITQGTLNTSASNYSITCERMNSNNSNVRGLTLNGSTVTCTGTTQPWLISTGGTFTLSAGTSTIVLSGGGGGTTISFGGGNLTYNNVTHSISSAPGIGLTISGNNTFNTLTLTSPSAGVIYDCAILGNQTITTLIANGSGATGRVRLRGNIAAAITLTVTTYTTKSDVDFQVVTAAGASAPWSGTRLGNLGGNTNITFTAAKTVYWNLAGTQNWSATGWATSSGGSPAVANFPLAQDTAIFDNTGAAGTVTLNQTWSLPTINASARTSAMTLATAASVSYLTAGSLILGTGITLNTLTSNTIYFVGSNAQTLTSAGKTWALNLYIGKTSGTLTLGDAFTSSGPTTFNALAVINGTFDASAYNVTVFGGNLQGTVLMGSGLWTLTGTGTIWNDSGTITKGTANILLSDTSTTARTFGSFSRSYNKLTIGGATGTSTTTIAGSNTFTEIASTKTVAHTLRLTAGSTTTVGAFTVAGSAGNVVTLDTTSAGSAATLSKSSGIVGVNYLSIRDSTATGGATWYAGANSTNVSNNTGWLFSNAPSGSGMMMAFFPV